MGFSDRELFARLIKCEAEGEGIEGMKSVATVIINRVNVDYGEYWRVNQGDIRKVITQPGQFTCLFETVGGQPNPRRIWDVTPDEIHYEVADWALAGNRYAVDTSLWYRNPFAPTCPDYFPLNRSGQYWVRIRKHCFYTPTPKYAET